MYSFQSVLNILLMFVFTLFYVIRLCSGSERCCRDERTLVNVTGRPNCFSRLTLFSLLQMESA